MVPAVNDCNMWMITGIDMAMKNTPDNSIISAPTRRGMALQPLSLAFNRVNYHVDIFYVGNFLF